MSESYGRWVVRVVGDRSIRQALLLARSCLAVCADQARSRLRSRLLRNVNRRARRHPQVPGSGRLLTPMMWQTPAAR